MKERAKRWNHLCHNLVYIEPQALEYPLGRELKEKFDQNGNEIRETTSHNQVRGIPGENELTAIPKCQINSCSGN